MDYNRQFQKLLKEAKENGYEFKNGTFTINEEEFHPVMEVMLQWHTTYESEGWYYIYKKTFQIDEKDFNMKARSPHQIVFSDWVGMNCEKKEKIFEKTLDNCQ